jgi:ADP-ribose pyrophosphatase YjhB (NUDIX family)
VSAVPRVAVAAVIFDAAGRVLLVQRGRPPGEGLWTVPGGKLEAGERLADAVVREVREETGLDVTCGALVEVVERMGDGWHYVILDYLATVIGGTLMPADDVRDARWTTPADRAALALTDGLEPVLAHADRLRRAPASGT